MYSNYYVLRSTTGFLASRYITLCSNKIRRCLYSFPYPNLFI